MNQTTLNLEQLLKLSIEHVQQTKMQTQMQRLYTRYPFFADVEIVDSSGVKMRMRITNISYGGCRLISNETALPRGTAITMRIHEPDEFEAAATVVHSSTNEMGVMFGMIPPPSLLILRKWIDGAR